MDDNEGSDHKNVMNDKALNACDLLRTANNVHAEEKEVLA